MQQAEKTRQERPQRPVLTPRKVIQPWVRQHKAALRALNPADLLEAVAAGVLHELRQTVAVIGRATERWGAARAHDDAIDFRYQLLVGAAARAHAHADARRRAGLRFIRDGEGLIVQVRLDEAACAAALELFEAVRALWTLYLHWRRTRPDPAPACLSSLETVAGAFRMRIRTRARALRARGERPR